MAVAVAEDEGWQGQHQNEVDPSGSNGRTENSWVGAELSCGMSSHRTLTASSPEGSGENRVCNSHETVPEAIWIRDERPAIQQQLHTYRVETTGMQKAHVHEMYRQSILHAQTPSLTKVKVF
eukprot:g46461.t1